MKFRDVKVTDFAGFLAEIRSRASLRQPVWFRGQSSADWNLAPTIARVPQGIAAEPLLITRFKQNALALLDTRPGNEWEWLFVMRHYGVPTRLMDWSESPLVSLFFAIGEDFKADGAFWCLLPIEMNLSAAIKPAHKMEIPGFGDSTILDNYLPSSLQKEQSSSLKPAAAIAQRNTRRIQAQHGVFTIIHREQHRIDEMDNGNHVWRLIIPARAKERFAKDLALLNIKRLTLFPELDMVGQNASEAVR
ncbi:MAG: FRG domain-containing protein [Alphaproteobacteria bacterium]|nr:FRG domain-containing protein [Alphaproteobacteria bacterium]